MALVFVLGGPVLAFLAVEQQLATASSRWQRIFLELPVVSEQLGMLLGAGYSLGAPCRAWPQGTSACGGDLVRVTGRIRQGLTEVEALREWATVADVDALRRLVSVLSLNRQAGDLGRLIGDEARSIRRDVHELVETDRAQGTTGVDPGHGERPGARRDLPGRAVHRGAAPLRQHMKE